MKFLLLFHIATRLNSQIPYETEIYNEIYLIDCILIPVYQLGIFEFSTLRK